MEHIIGKGDWDSLVTYFEDIVAVNSWEDDGKLLWLRVRLTERARTAYQGLSAEAKPSYKLS